MNYVIEYVPHLVCFLVGALALLPCKDSVKFHKNRADNLREAVRSANMIRDRAVAEAIESEEKIDQLEVRLAAKENTLSISYREIARLTQDLKEAGKC